MRGDLPRSELAENALRLVLRVREGVSAHQSKPDVGRIVPVSSDLRLIRESSLRESSLLQIVSIVEALVDSLAVERMDQILPGGSLTVEKMLDEFRVNSLQTWQSRKDSYRTYFEFSLESCNGWSCVNSGIEVRNCLVHGFGALTEQQKRKSKLSAQLKEIDTFVDDGRVQLTANTVPALASGAVGFIRDVAKKIASCTNYSS